MRKEELKNQRDLIQAFKNYKNQLYKYVYFRVYQNTEIAEDITQDAFLRAWKYRQSFDSSKSKLKTWLYNIACNLIADHFKNSKEKTLDLEKLPEVEDKFNDLDKLVTNSLMKEYIYKKMRTLSLRDQELLTLRYISDQSIEEVSKIIDKSYDATKMAINRALKKLKNIIKDEDN